MSEWETVVEGVVMNDGLSGVSGIGGGVMRSAGLGTVLYVEPREVYLPITEQMSVLINWQMLKKTLTLDHTTCSREHSGDARIPTRQSKTS